MQSTPSPRLPPLPIVGDAWALFLDVDGTLADLMPHPDEVVIPAETKSALAELFERLDGALAIVSGRPIAQIDKLLAPLSLPAGGLHGLERRVSPGGTIDRVNVPPWRGEVIDALGPISEEAAGVWLEDKEITLGLHYRGAPERETEIRALTRSLEERRLPGMAVQHGKFIVEFRPTGADKGDTILAFAENPPFRGRRLVFIGDDITDENGFAAVKQSGGISIRVGSAPDTLAQWILPTVGDTQDWILQLTETLRTPGGASIE